jgi:hypothetical protein
MSTDFSHYHSVSFNKSARWIEGASFGNKRREDAAAVPRKAGVYVFRHIESGAHIYVGESANLRSRLLQRYVKKTESTLTRAIRRHLSLTTAPIETIRKKLLRDYEFDYYLIPFGRREIEEFLQKKLKIKQPNKEPEPTNEESMRASHVNTSRNKKRPRRGGAR